MKRILSSINTEKRSREEPPEKSVREDAKVIEGNKAIMEFEGFETMKSRHFPDADDGEIIVLGELKYHSSWDWLQPAWSKFYTLCETTLRGNEKLYNEFADLRDNYNIHANHNNVSAACETLVEGIKWYNDSQQSK